MDNIAAVDRAITTRRSVRRFLPEPVPRATVEEILAVASRAPSGTNMQPWRVHVLAGERKQALSEALWQRTATSGSSTPRSIATIRRNGSSRISGGGAGSAGTCTGSSASSAPTRPGMHRQHGRNYLFFDAPVGLIFTIDRRLEKGSWLDYGMFLQNVWSPRAPGGSIPVRRCRF